MIKSNEPITPDRLKYVGCMSIKTICNLAVRVDQEISKAYPRFDEPLETCYDMIFNELYRRDKDAIDRWIDGIAANGVWENPYKYFAQEVNHE